MYRHVVPIFSLKSNCALQVGQINLSTFIVRVAHVMVVLAVRDMGHVHRYW